MHDRAIFVKSFNGDFDRLPNLIASWERYNRHLPLLISVPANDIPILRQNIDLPKSVEVVSDESYVEKQNITGYGWLSQQISKLSVHRTAFAESYYLIDSDAYFINTLNNNRFSTEGKMSLIASTVNNRYSATNDDLKDLIFKGRSFALMGDVDLQFNMERVHELRASQKSGRLVQDSSKNYAESCFEGSARGFIQTLNFAPSPVFHSRILTALEEQIADLGLSFIDLIWLSPWEYTWYGLYALSEFKGQLVYADSDSIHFAKDSDIDDAKAAGVDSEILHSRFNSIHMAARHFETQYF